jgi:ABC-type antimicrobial peptide transport system permease subunit
MTTVKHAATTASQRRSGAITLAAILYCWFGLAFLISSLLIVTSALRNGELPVMFGIEMLAGPFSERLGLGAALAATVLWGIVNVLEVLAGYWLWKSRKHGGKLGLLLFPAGLIFWIGYALPIMVVIGPLRVLLLARGWKTLR